MKRRSRPWWLLLTAIGASVLLATGCTVWRLGEARALARASEPFEQQPPVPLLRLLVAGDSTGVGTGASDPAFSVAGLLGTAYPRLAIANRARDGALFGEVAQQLAASDGQKQAGWDLILISAGGNDVIRGTDSGTLAQALDQSFKAARARLAPGGRVLVQPPGNVGHAPFFLPPLSTLMNSRAAELHAAVRAAAARHGVTLVDMARPPEQDPFVQRPELNASDGLHPSDAGYRVWRDELLAQTGLAARLEAAR
jgi:lysophospholipase L1-like esterase